MKRPLISINLIIVLIFAITIQNCERDDICAEGTLTTPRLVLRFFDNTLQEDLKTVPNLLILGLDDDNIPVDLDVSVTSTDSLAIPLRTDINETRFLFIMDSDGTTEVGNIDTLTVTYERADIFISRACGFANNFNITGIMIEPDNDNWVLNSEVIRENVEDEISAHVQIFH